MPLTHSRRFSTSTPWIWPRLQSLSDSLSPHGLMSPLEAGREVLGDREKSGNIKPMTKKTRWISKKSRSTRMTWTTTMGMAEGRASEGEAITHRVGTGEQRRSGGGRWRRKCSGRGCGGSDRRGYNNGVDSISSSGTIHRALYTLTEKGAVVSAIESEYMRRGWEW